MTKTVRIYQCFGKSYKTLSACYLDNTDKTKVGIHTVRKRLKKGWGLEKAISTPKQKTFVSKFGPHCVENVLYPNLPAVAAAYGLSLDCVYKRHARGATGDELVPLEKRKTYVELVYEPEGKCLAGGQVYKNESIACREHGVPLGTFRSRKKRGMTNEQALGLYPFPDRRRKNKTTVTRKKNADIRQHDLPKRNEIHLAPQKNSPPRRGIKIVVDGKEYCSKSAAARAHGLTPEVFFARLTYQKSIEEALGLRRRITKRSVVFNDKTYDSLAHIADTFGIVRQTLRSRLHANMSLADAVSAGRRITNPGRYNLTMLKRDPELANSPGVLYFGTLIINGKLAYKIGITKKEANKRFTCKKYKFKVKKTVQGTLMECFLLEQELFRFFREQRDLSISAKMIDGHSEIYKFSESDVARVLAILNKGLCDGQ